MTCRSPPPHCPTYDLSPVVAQTSLQRIESGGNRGKSRGMAALPLVVQPAPVVAREGASPAAWQQPVAVFNRWELD
jgi:hypothetical protein